MHTTSLLICSVIFTAAFAVEVDENVGLRAASRNRNCGCQCSSLTFKDKYGNIKGNCKSVDNTGATWCYVESGYSTCQDLRTSTRFNKQWSYEACATPEVTSYECQGYNNGYNNGNNNGYNNGYNNGGSGYNNGNNNGYNNGYNSGSNNGYPCRDSSCNSNSGYNNGYGSGSSIGSSSWNTGSSSGYNTGSSSGYNTGSSLGGILTGGSSNGGYPVRGSTRGGSATAAKDTDAINFEQ